MLHTLQIKPEHVGVHPRNRDGCGVNGADVHRLVAAIYEIGWDSAQTASAACTDASGDDWSYNEKVMRASDGRLPPMQGMKFVSLACSHTNQGLRAIKAAVDTENTNMTLDGKKFSFSKLQEEDAKCAAAVQDGLQWTARALYIGNR